VSAGLIKKFGGDADEHFGEGRSECAARENGLCAAVSESGFTR